MKISWKLLEGWDMIGFNSEPVRCFHLVLLLESRKKKKKRKTKKNHKYWRGVAT